MKYGIANTLMAFGKIEISNVSERFEFKISNPTQGFDNITIYQNHQKLIGGLGLQRTIYKDDLNVLSSSFAIHSG